jgi:hypothetical protein
MKIKSPAQVSDPDKKTSPSILKHIQAVTDDVRGILEGGLSFNDKQLPFQVRSVFVTSGQPIFLTMQAPYIILGCYPILTNGAIVNNFTSTFNNGKFSITLNMNVMTAQIVFLMVGNNV